MLMFVGLSLISIASSQTNSWTPMCPDALQQFKFAHLGETYDNEGTCYEYLLTHNAPWYCDLYNYLSNEEPEKDFILQFTLPLSYHDCGHNTFAEYLLPTLLDDPRSEPAFDIYEDQSEDTMNIIWNTYTYTQWINKFGEEGQIFKVCTKHSFDLTQAFIKLETNINYKDITWYGPVTVPDLCTFKGYEQPRQQTPSLPLVEETQEGEYINKIDAYKSLDRSHSTIPNSEFSEDSYSPRDIDSPFTPIYRYDNPMDTLPNYISNTKSENSQSYNPMDSLPNYVTDSEKSNDFGQEVESEGESSSSEDYNWVEGVLKDRMEPLGELKRTDAYNKYLTPQQNQQIENVLKRRNAIYDMPEHLKRLYAKMELNEYSDSDDEKVLKPQEAPQTTMLPKIEKPVVVRHDRYTIPQRTDNYNELNDVSSDEQDLDDEIKYIEQQLAPINRDDYNRRKLLQTTTTSEADELCYEPKPFDIDECLYACGNTNETEWNVEFLEYYYDEQFRSTVFVYEAETSQTPGVCTAEELSQFMTSWYLMFNGCCDVDINDVTTGVKTYEEYEFLKGGWLFKSTLRPGEKQQFMLYVKGNIQPVKGSYCVRGDNVRCACSTIYTPDLCSIEDSGVLSNMADSVDYSSSSSSSSSSSHENYHIYHHH